MKTEHIEKIYQGASTYGTPTRVGTFYLSFETRLNLKTSISEISKTYEIINGKKCIVYKWIAKGNGQWREKIVIDPEAN